MPPSTADDRVVLFLASSIYLAAVVMAYSAWTISTPWQAEGLLASAFHVIAPWGLVW